ncbi:MAG TPA: PD-(D/E)XK nuclease family protein, partial [Deinococcales bacterium]|nr:PD-(D/E)XK nuclease family protein [Deinococcales bacterium]
KAETGEDAEAFLVHLDPAHPDQDPLPYRPEHLDEDLRRVVANARAFASAKRFPARPGPLCPYCGYRDRCVEGRGGPPPA